MNQPLVVVIAFLFLPTFNEKQWESFVSYTAQSVLASYINNNLFYFLSSFIFPPEISVDILLHAYTVNGK